MKHAPASSSRTLAALGLRQPVRLLTSQQLDERRVLAMWQGIERRSRTNARRLDSAATPLGALAATLRRASLMRAALLSPSRLALAVALTLLLVMGWSQLLSSPLPAPAGPLVTATGQRFESVEAGEQHPERVSFADGSHIEAAPGTRVEGLAATDSEFVVLLRRGQARFSVTPGGPRRWLVEARGARIEVVGTVFSVESRAGSFAVRVEAGVVLVRSPLLADGVQRLSAGQTLRLEVGLDAETEVEPAPTSAPKAAPPPAPTPAEPAPEWGRERAARGLANHQPRAAAVPLPQRKPPQRGTAEGRAPDSAVELWAQADAARRAGDAASAAGLLERLIDEYPRDSQAGLGAYTLGVLQLEQLAAPRAAARRFRQALELGIAAGLRESCYLRQTEALRHAGDEGAARQVARQYLRSFPMGEQRDAMQRLLTAHESPDSARGRRGGRSQ